MALDSGTELEQTVRQLLDRLGHSKPDRGVADGSVSLAKLAGLKFGSASVTFGGASTRSNALTVPHGLGEVPGGVFAFGRRPAGTPSLNWSADDPAPDATNFTVAAITSDGTTPVAGTTRLFYWLAVA